MGRPIQNSETREQEGQVHGDGANLSTLRFEQDRRKFPEILHEWFYYEKSLWLEHESHTGRKRSEKDFNGQEFLKQTGLTSALSEEDFHNMELGTKIPDKRLARIMSICLPGGVLRPQEPLCASLPQIYGFQARAKYWRKLGKNAQKPILEVTDESFNHFCVNALNGIWQKTAIVCAVPVDISEPELPAGPDMREKILSSLSGISKVSAEEIRELLITQYRKWGCPR